MNILNRRIGISSPNVMTTLIIDSDSNSDEGSWSKKNISPNDYVSGNNTKKLSFELKDVDSLTASSTLASIGLTPSAPSSGELTSNEWRIALGSLHILHYFKREKKNISFISFFLFFSLFFSFLRLFLPHVFLFIHFTVNIQLISMIETPTYPSPK